MTKGVFPHHFLTFSQNNTPACTQKHTEEQLQRVQEAAAEEEMKSMGSVVNGVSRIAWTTALNTKATQYSSTGNDNQPMPSNRSNQNKILKNILSALQLNRVDLSISKLDDHSKVVFPVLFFCFSCFYWLYYSFSQQGSDQVDEF